MKKFTLGIVTGASSLALAVPLLAQMSAAQTGSSSTEINISDREAPTQECLLAMVGLEDAHLENFDAMSEARKQKMQTHRDALAEIAAIADDEERKEAMQEMHEQMRAKIDEAVESIPASLSSAMEGVRTACGDRIKMMHRGAGMKMKMGMGHPGGKLHKMKRFGHSVDGGAQTSSESL